MKRAMLKVVACVVAATGCASALAQPTFPNRPIRLVIPFTAGSQTDVLARLIGPRLGEKWGHQIVVDNRPSGGGVVAGSMVAGATPDGHTLIMNSSAFAVSAALYPKLPYDTLKDFSGVAQVATTALVLVVSPSSGFRTARDLFEAARQKPGEIRFSSAGIGSGTHFGAEAVRLAAGIQAVHVPYRGSPEALNDAATGRVHFFMAPAVNALPFVRGGRVLALGVTTPQREPMFPDVPTLGESALPGFSYEGWYAVFAPARVPRPIVESIAREINRVVDTPEMRERFLALGTTPKTGTPADLDRLMRREVEERGKVIKAAGVKPE